MKKIITRYKNFPVQVRASFWFLICSFMQKGISIITTPIFTRLFNAAEYGQYSVFNSWLGIATIFVTLQLYSGVYTQGLVKYSEDRKVYSSTLQGLTLFLCICWTIVYLLFHDFWNTTFTLTTTQMLGMMVMIWATGAFNLWAGEQRVQYKYHKLVLITLIVSIAKPTIGIVFVIFSDDKVTARILGLALVEVIGYCGLFVVQLWRGKKFCSKKYWKHALAFNMPLIPHYLSQTVLNSADRIMIRNMNGAEEAGIYSLAYSISQIMTLFNTALSHTLSPWVYQKIKAGKTDDITRVGYISIVIISFVNLVLIAAAPEAVRIFAPISYHDAIWVIPPVAISVVFAFSYDLFAKFEFYFEKTRFIMIASVSGALLNIILNYIFIKEFGYLAAAYTTLICFIIYACAHYFFMKKICKRNLPQMKTYNTKILLVIYSLLIMAGFALMATYNYPYIRYTIILVISFIVVIKRRKLMELVHSLFQVRQYRQMTEESDEASK